MPLTTCHCETTPTNDDFRVAEPCTFHHSLSHRIAHMLLDDIAQRAGSEMGVEAALDEEREDFGGGGDVDAFFGEEGEFGGEHGFGDVELHFVGEAVEDEFFGDAGEEFGAECARGSAEDVALHCGEWGVLELHHVGGSKVGREDDVEIGEVQCFAGGEGDAGGV